MNIDALIVKLKEMGLGRIQRANVLETYRDVGYEEAMEQAIGYQTTSQKQVDAATVAAADLFGLNI